MMTEAQSRAARAQEAHLLDVIAGAGSIDPARLGDRIARTLLDSFTPDEIEKIGERISRHGHMAGRAQA